MLATSVFTASFVSSICGGLGVIKTLKSSPSWIWKYSCYWDWTGLFPSPDLLHVKLLVRLGCYPHLPLWTAEKVTSLLFTLRYDRLLQRQYHYHYQYRYQYQLFSFRVILIIIGSCTNILTLLKCKVLPSSHESHFTLISFNLPPRITYFAMACNGLVEGKVLIRNNNVKCCTLKPSAKSQELYEWIFRDLLIFLNEDLPLRKVLYK